MSRNGSGTWSAPSNSWNPAVSGSTVDPTDWASFLADLTTAISASVANDGQTTTTAKVPFAYGIDISAATGGQINFPATQNPAAGANVLDDYEEGTWLPTFAGTTTAGTGTYSPQLGTYTKIGRLVTCHFELTASSLGTAAGSLLLASLPFTSVATYRGALICQEWTGFNLPAGFTHLSGSVIPSTTTARFMRNGGTTTNATAMSIFDIAAAITVIGTVIYHV